VVISDKLYLPLVFGSPKVILNPERSLILKTKKQIEQLAGLEKAVSIRKQTSEPANTQ